MSRRTGPDSVDSNTWINGRGGFIAATDETRPKPGETARQPTDLVA